jgi:hypothetical protein
MRAEQKAQSMSMYLEERMRRTVLFTTGKIRLWNS